MTGDVIAMRQEIDRIARSRQDAIAAHPATRSKCPPHAALLHRVAGLITSEDLPAATISITPKGEVLVDLTGNELVENGVRRYAAALELVVTVADVEVRGFAAKRWIASGFDGHNAGVGAWWCISADELLPTPIVDRFGVGVGALS